MNKTELIKSISQDSDISIKAAERALEAFTSAIKKSLKSGDEVTIPGFGKFHITERAAREGRNPSNGAAIKIKASKVPKFTPGKKLKDSFN